MKKVKVNDITSRQMMAIIVGTIIGSGIVGMPNAIVKQSAQDSWISSIIGGVYPLYIVIMSMLMYKKHPNESILVLSKKYMGIILGNIFNIIFISYFLFIGLAVVSGLKNILFTFIVAFSTPSKIIIVITAASLMTACAGLKVIGKINEILLYLTLILLSTSLIAYTRGSMINIMPIGQSGFKGIMLGAKETLYFYSGAEIMTLIYPCVTDKENIKKYAYLSVLITTLVYTWVVFSTIYFMGIDIIPKSIWSFLTVTKAIDVPIINNFRFIFMVLWGIVTFKTSGNFFFATSYGINYFLNLKNLKKICVFLFPLIFILSYMFKNEVFRRDILDKITPIYVIFNILFITFIVIVSYSKRDENKCS